MDPFYLIKQEIMTDVEHVQELLDTRNDMIHDHRGINVEVFRNLGIQMSNEVNSIKGLLKDIQESNEQVRLNPKDFRISETELNNRNQFCANINKEINVIEEKLKEQSNNQKVIYHPDALQSIPHFNEISNNPSGEQSVSLEEHTEQLNQIEETTNIQLQLAKEIDHEFDDQQNLILDLDRDVTTANEAMVSVTKKIKGIIEAEGKVPTTLALVLALALIVLLFFAI